MAPKKKEIGGLGLGERLSRWAADPSLDPELLNQVTGAFERAEKSYGFDKAAPTTKNRRNRHLAEFENFSKALATNQGVVANDAFIWGKDTIEKNFRAYIQLAASLVAPRSYRAESIKFQTLVQRFVVFLIPLVAEQWLSRQTSWKQKRLTGLRRQSIIYWIQHKSPADVEMKKMWNASQEALYHAFRTLNKSTHAAEKQYMTKHDLGE